MSSDQMLADVQRLLNAEVHLRNNKKAGKPDHGYVSASPYLRLVSCESGLAERIETIWKEQGSEAARLEVLRLALKIVE